MDTDERSPATSPDAAPAARTRKRSGWRVLAWLSAAVGALIVLPLAAMLGGAWWMVGDARGTAWLLAHLPGVEVVAPKGALLGGDFSAQRLEVRSVPGVSRLALDGLGWRGFSVEFDRARRQPHLRFAELHATRVELELPPSTSPAKAPTSLAWPLELEVQSLHVDEFRSPLIGAQPLHDVRAQLHLGAEDGALHRVDAVSLAWGPLRASGAARIGTAAPLNVNAAVDLIQAAAAPANAASAASAASAPAAPSAASAIAATWNARATLAGPLEAPALQATLRASPGPQRPAQSLDAQATLSPFAPWPLGDLKLNTKALDLAAFANGAPTTSLNVDALAQTRGLDQPVIVTLTLANAAAGRWNEARLPLRSLQLDLRGQPKDTSTLELHTFDADLGDAKQSAGRVQGTGRWTRERWSVAMQLKELQPALLDTRAPTMRLDGPVTLAGNGFGAATLDAATIDLKTDLTGRLADRGPARAVQLALDATLGQRAIELRSAQASAAGARASLAGKATRGAADAPWRVLGQTTLVDFDPTPWWPGNEGSPWRKGPHRLNAKGEFDLTLPKPGDAQPLATQLATLRGHADVQVAKSVLAGVPLEGAVHVRSVDSGPVSAQIDLDAAGNTLRAEGRLSPTGSGADDTWDVTIDAATLDRLAPLWVLMQAGGTRAAGAPPKAAPSAGRLTAQAHVSGRWPTIRTQGRLDANAARFANFFVQRAEARWQMGTSLNDTIDAQLTLAQAGNGSATLESLQLDLKGTGRDHQLDLRAESKSLPPAWVDNLQPVNGATPAAPPPQATAASAPAAAASSANAVSPPGANRTLARVQAHGGIFDIAGAPFAGWRGSVAQLDLRGNGTRTAAWVSTRDVGLEWQWAEAGNEVPHLVVQPGRADVLGAALRWSRIGWQAPTARTPAQLDVDAELEPVAVAPLLARLQPDFGWGGDLAITGHVKVRSAPTFSADIVLERRRGDLTVTDETETQALDLTDLRVAVNAADGTWNFTQAAAGKTLGVLAGAVVARTSPQATWPAADTPISGVLELQVANLGTWGTWVPAGWRLGGALRTSATIGGRFGAPEYTGEMHGSGLSVRNFLQGVNVSDGDLSIALQGDTARIERFTAKGGAGTVALEGDATLGAVPRAQLKLTADKFQLLGRVDRRIVTSGSARVQLDRTSLVVDGQFGVDEGLIDFTRSDAPALASDVEVIRAKPVEAAPAAPRATATPTRSVTLDLKVALGEKLRLKGRGIDTGLGGELRLTAPGGKLAVNGSVNTFDGTYAAYGQKLSIDRGVIAFSGVVDNPRLDIEATRPNLDTRVGVLITGTAQNPRIRLFSEPELSDLDKLSWLVLGRASDGLGRADTALLQTAAVALLSGEGEGITDQFTRAIGLDAVSLKQSDGDVKETVISLGKQLSRRWYVGYERGLNATSGTWQLIYRAAQKFTLRAQSGLDNSLDVIWTWRWQ